MFLTDVCGEKSFATEQKIRELKQRIFQLRSLNKSQSQTNDIISKATDNMNKTPSEKYDVKADTLERKSLTSESFRIRFDFHRLKKNKKNDDRLRCKKRIDSRKKLNLEKSQRREKKGWFLQRD